MQKEILKKFLIVILTALMICSVIFSKAMSNIIIDKMQQDMLYSLRLIDRNIDYENNLLKQIEELNTITMTDDTRITLITRDGAVLADTAADGGLSENHKDRKEVTQTLENGYGRSNRYSETTHQDMIYVCSVSEKSDYLLRLSMPFNIYHSYFSAIIPSVLVSVVLAFAVSVILAKKFSKSVTESLIEISDELSIVEIEKVSFPVYKFDELNKISKAVEKMSDRVQNSMQKLRYERNKIEYILDNMNEGIVLIDENQNVVTINKSATNILGHEKRKQHENIMYYTQNADIVQSVEQSILTGERFVFDIENTDARIYSVYISKIQRGVFDELSSGVSVLLVDVTADRNAQKMRQEFFSNVSHEMKTPITSIQGFAELMETGIVTNPDQCHEFLARIKKETQNMTNLINDILMISRLETKDLRKSVIPINIKATIDDVIATVMPMAEKNHIKITADCDNVFIKADTAHIHQLVNNLVVNAIKYNKENGSIHIILQQQDNIIYLTVQDTGIGIPVESKNRIFERFYRVDKGRSRKMGGTGLGLSIVKHIVQFYHGSIDLESRLDIGTTITIKLPAEV